MNTMIQTDAAVADQLFTESVEQQDWVEATDHHHIIDKIDRTLGLIAEANQVNQGLAPVQHYDISIIVPVYNERQTLPKVLARLEEVMPAATELIIVDDGSTDGTKQWLEDLPEKAGRTVLLRRANHGKGSAVRLAIKHSQGKVVAIQDADLEYDPADLLRVVWPVLNGDSYVAYGSRYMENIDDPSLIHRMGNWALTQASNAMSGIELTDMETCHKAFNGDLIRSIELREQRFGFEPEVTAKVAARGYTFLEVPTRYKGRSYDQGKKIGWRDAISAVACMWKYRKGEPGLA